MTESEWATCTDAAAMLDFVAPRKGRGWERKLRLFACACFREVWQVLHKSCQAVVEAVERDAGGQAPPDLLPSAVMACEYARLGCDVPLTPGGAMHDSAEPGWRTANDFLFG